MDLEYAKMYIKTTASSLSLQPQLMALGPDPAQPTEHHPAIAIVTVEPDILKIAHMFAMLPDILGICVQVVVLRLSAAVFATVNVLLVFLVDVSQARGFAAMLVRSLLFAVEGQ